MGFPPTVPFIASVAPRVNSTVAGRVVMLQVTAAAGELLAEGNLVAEAEKGAYVRATDTVKALVGTVVLCLCPVFGNLCAQATPSPPLSKI